jgi:hypothetical protein
MAKKKKRSGSPNLPQESLDQAAQDVQPTADDPEAPKAVARPAATPLNPRPVRVRASASARRAEAAAQAASRGDYSMYGYDPVERREREIARIKREKEKKGQLDLSVMRERLANPTRNVTTEELANEYGYVVRDLRSIALLSGGLILLLIVLATVLPSNLG